MSAYFKALVAAVVAGGGAVAVGLEDGSLSSGEWIATILAILGSGGVVWYVTNGPGGEYAKAIVGALSVGLGSLATAVEDDLVTSQEWVTAIVAALGALIAVGAVANRPPGP
jgi:peptidoglycan/LPS O-acetylase OafA/YrhL